MSTTPYGVCYDIVNTPYTVETGGVVYHFATQKHADKFRLGLLARMEWLEDSLSRRFKIFCPGFGPLAAYQWYRICEPNAFCIEIDGEVETCPDALEFDGRQLRKIGSERQSEATMLP